MITRFYRKEEMIGYQECYDMATNNHILIGGRTGSGKSVLLNDFLWTFLAYHPSDIQFMLIDPKRVELSWYKNVPHCMRYASDVSGAVQILNSAIKLIEKRYKKMERKHIRTYNGQYVFVIIDELADLMLTSKRVVMPLIQKIGQLGRACRVFLICATQAPSRKVIPAEVTLNLGCKIALSCESAIESRQIIGQNGAEELPRYGYCLIKTCESVTLTQVPMVSEEELNKRIDYWKRNRGSLSLFW